MYFCAVSHIPGAAGVVMGIWHCVQLNDPCIRSGTHQWRMGCSGCSWVNAISCVMFTQSLLDDQIAKTGKMNYITIMDFCKGHCKVTSEQKSKERTAFRGPLGLLQFTLMTFDLHGAPAALQQITAQATRGRSISRTFSWAKSIKQTWPWTSRTWVRKACVHCASWKRL